MLRANESSTQAPCGFGQALITKLLVEEWGMKGYFRWLKGQHTIITNCVRIASLKPIHPGIKAQYRERRNTLVDSLIEESHADLDARLSSSQRHVYELVAKDTRGRDEKGFLSEKGESTSKTLLSFVAPQGGMFGAPPSADLERLEI